MEGAPTIDAEEKRERTRLYERHRDDLSKRQLSNAENLDKTILTYSGAGLALSLGFLKDFVPVTGAKIPWALYGSWGGFTLAMVLVVVSYMLSLHVIDRQLDRARRYYLEGDDDALTESGWQDFCARHLNTWMSAAAFVVALSLTTIFVSANLSEVNMANSKGVRGIAQDGVTGMAMQRITPQATTEQRGITGSAMQPVTSGSSSSPAASSPPSGSTTPASKG
ncbi:hypothetical protein PHO31112_01650 [Pandoraea horticolens]|uniref:Transmembrane protein n=1 Tax=Pandoraea horticolens TaxID=2508298 RepID=A0A5E4TV06_9BURK|nr:hypothetical protein [Pandoraea horticolens]VVD91607.1 hypothetical protein PHO31112_01650 [Pandoraea horticolens]